MWSRTLGSPGTDAHRAELLEVLPEGGAEHLLLVPDPQQVHAQQGAVVQQTPLEVPLEGWLRAHVPPGQLDADHPSSRLQGREEGEEVGPIASCLFVLYVWRVYS